MQPDFQSFLHRQIPVLILLSVFPGLGYIFLGWLHGVHRPALLWYAGILLISAWGVQLYRGFQPDRMSRRQRVQWHHRMLLFYWLFFLLWTVIFLIYADETASHLHYIAIFTQIGATTVAATLLFPEPRLYRPLIPLMSAVLSVYFFVIGEWYSYVLATFAAVLGWVLYYSASNSHRLLLRTHHQATHDMLTGLYNRQYFIDQLQQTINTLREHATHSYLMLIDLDYFKTVNDSLGHDLGDQLLKEVSARLLTVLPEGDVLARLGGDEFIIIGDEITDSATCERRARSTARELLDTLKSTYHIQGHQLHISASIGIRMIRAGEDAANHLVREADIAMYEVKAAGRNDVFMFSDEMSARVEQHLEIERLLHFALEQNEISLHFQPQLDSKRRVVGAECLARWHNTQYGNIPPDRFIPVAEETGLIIDLGNYILANAFRSLRNWSTQGLALQQLSINISVRQFMHYEFVATVKQLVEVYLDEPLRQLIVFEITESLVAEDVERIIDTMHELHALGIRFSMDDFGTGYSSLGSLKQLPIDEVKIDRKFVTDLESDADNQAMIITILNIARFFGLSVVAEGIEQEGQFQFLLKHGCDMFQGYHFARPMTAQAFLDFCHTTGPAEA